MGKRKPLSAANGEARPQKRTARMSGGGGNKPRVLPRPSAPAAAAAVTVAVQPITLQALPARRYPCSLQKVRALQREAGLASHVVPLGVLDHVSCGCSPGPCVRRWTSLTETEQDAGIADEPSLSEDDEDDLRPQDEKAATLQRWRTRLACIKRYAAERLAAPFAADELKGAAALLLRLEQFSRDSGPGIPGILPIHSNLWGHYLKCGLNRAQFAPVLAKVNNADAQPPSLLTILPTPTPTPASS